MEASTKYNNFGILAPHVYEDNKYSPYNSLDLSLDKHGELLKIKKYPKKNFIPDGDCCVDAVNATAMLVKRVS